MQKSFNSELFIAIEDLEGRVLFASTLPWGATAQLVRQNTAVSDFPTITGQGQTIAVIDTGIDYNLPELGAGFGAGHKVVGGWDFVDDDADPMDTVGHGTKVAGVLASSSFNLFGSRYRGIAPDAQLVALRIDDSEEAVPNTRIEDALKWVINHRTDFGGIDIVNISFGYGHFKTDFSDKIFGDELKTLADDGVFIVSSSGNSGVADGPGIEYPGADPNVVSVGSVDQFDVISEFTERGPNLEMLAPGQDVATTTLDGPDTVSGTSFAAPFVAGAAALMKQLNPLLKPRDILSILRAGGKDNLDGDEEFGSGLTQLKYPRLDIDNSLHLAVARTPGLSGSEDDLGVNGNNNSLIFDNQGVLHFAYFDSGEGTIKYATRSTDGNWSTVQNIDNSGDIVGTYLSMALDQRGRPAIAYFDVAHSDLKYSAFDGSQWNAQTVDSKNSVGLYPSLIFDSHNDPAIAYYRKTSGDLKFATLKDSGWGFTNLDTGDDSGRSPSLAMNSDGKLAVAYENSTSGWLRFVEQTGTTWIRSTIDKFTRGVSYISLAYDQGNHANVSYYDANPGDLKYGYLSDGAWQNVKLATRGAVGLYSQLKINDDGKPSILYYDRRSNSVYNVVGGLNRWSYNQLVLGGGKFLDADEDPTKDDIVFSWFKTDTNVLRFADA
ncbi:MAG TPA: S8 family serine peptidase [Tepidisphaeraceae bacterium]|nr:S8 family serine peptidase [Tepidisphaeraceae bacterium]